MPRLHALKISVIVVGGGPAYRLNLMGQTWHASNNSRFGLGVKGNSRIHGGTYVDSNALIKCLNCPALPPPPWTKKRHTSEASHGL